MLVALDGRSYSHSGNLNYTVKMTNMTYDSENHNTVMVTGGCGFLGSHIVDALVADGFMVVAASRNPTKYLDSAASCRALDLHDAAATAALIDGVKPCAILHTVTAGPMARGPAHDKEYAATKNLLEISLKAASVMAFIYTSSAEAVANSNGLSKIAESEAILHNDSSAPTSYARVKAASERLVLSHNRSLDHTRQENTDSLRTVILRMPGIYGPRDGSITPGLLQGTNTIVSKIQFGDDKSMNEWIYVKNAASAHLLATKALLVDEECQVEGEAFFLSDGEPLTLWVFARKLWAAAGDKNVSRSDKRAVYPGAPIVALATIVEFLTLMFTFGRVLPLQYMRFGAWWDITKAKEQLKYVPVMDTDEGIATTVAWFQEQSK